MPDGKLSYYPVDLGLYVQLGVLHHHQLQLDRHYSVILSDGNSFGGYFDLERFNRGEDSILDQKYKKQISWDL